MQADTLTHTEPNFPLSINCYMLPTSRQCSSKIIRFGMSENLSFAKILQLPMFHMTLFDRTQVSATHFVIGTLIRY